MARATPNSGQGPVRKHTDTVQEALRLQVPAACLGSVSPEHRAGHPVNPPAEHLRCAQNWPLGPIFRTFVLTGFLLGLPLCAPAETQLEQTRARFEAAQKNYAAHPDDAEAGWKFGQACFDLADIASSRDERGDVAQKGIDACRHAIAQAPKSAPSHYYLGLDLGQLARTRSFGALKLVDQMEQELLEAARLDAHFDQAGPDRSLGLLYRDAPSLISVGNRSKAREHLRRAVELAPDFPENRLDLIESYLKWGDRPHARQELAELEKGLPKAHEKFKGPEWAASWSDWEARLRSAKEKLEEDSRLQSPRH